MANYHTVLSPASPAPAVPNRSPVTSRFNVALFAGLVLVTGAWLSLSCNPTGSVTSSTPTYTLSVQSGGHGTVTPIGNTTVPRLVSTAIFATPDAHYHFVNWIILSGTSVMTIVDPYSANTTITLTDDATVQANFAIDTCSLLVATNANGSVSPAGTQSVDYGLPAAISATPDAGYHFVDWIILSDTSVATISDPYSANTTITLTDDATVQANFAINVYSLSITAGSNGWVFPNGIQNVDYGASTPIIALPNTGYHFIDWVILSGTSVTTIADPYSANTTITLTGDATVRANFAIVRFVDGNATGAGTGVSWADAFTDLQDALAVAGPGEEIWVASGTYFPTFITNRDATFQLRDGVSLYGGFTGNETQRNQRDPSANITILSGDIGTTGDPSDNSYSVVIGANDARLDGFTISNGNADDAAANWDDPGQGGGGMHNSNVSGLYIINCVFSNNSAISGGNGMFNAYSSLVVTNCVFENNLANANGGGMYNYFLSSPLNITNSVFNNNSANIGGGIDSYSSPLIITNSVFTNNTTIRSGGGLSCRSNSSAIVTDCIFDNNTAKSGGGVSNASSSSTITNCVFTNNSANLGGDGGGVFNTSSSPTITNCIIWNNAAVTNGIEVYNGDGSTTGSCPTFINCDIRGGWNGPNVYNETLSSPVDNGGNIDLNPLFLNASDPDGVDDTWFTPDDGLSLTASSPCIDAGTSTNAPSDDITGEFRPQDGDNSGNAGYDIGAYEFVP